MAPPGKLEPDIKQAPFGATTFTVKTNQKMFKSAIAEYNSSIGEGVSGDKGNYSQGGVNAQSAESIKNRSASFVRMTSIKSPYFEQAKPENSSKLAKSSKDRTKSNSAIRQLQIQRMATSPEISHQMSIDKEGFS